MNIIEEFLQKNKIVVTIVAGVDDPYVIPEWAHDKYDYTVIIRRDNEVFQTEFYKGNETPPTVTDVISCLVSDYETLGDGYWQFEEWASDLGYSDDSIKALKIFEQVCEASRNMARVVGDYEKLRELAQVTREFEEN